MDKTIHRIRKRIIVSSVAVFLSALVVIPSSPVMRHPNVRDSVVTVSSLNDQSVEKDVEPEEESGREAANRTEIVVARG
ncbi:MAG: hypothetical protein HGA16_03530 [Candidatus Moranbacteria bacterium]|nr:hypothetical protein [Candidatus Moranbacteria bacterium]